MAANIQPLPPDTPSNSSLPYTAPSTSESNESKPSQRFEHRTIVTSAIEAAKLGIEKFPGPSINNLPTEIRLFSPPKVLSQSAPSILSSLYIMINEAFAESGSASKCLPSSVQRLQSEGQLVEELGDEQGTFCYVMYYPHSGQVLGTASAQPYLGPGVTEAKSEDKKKVFARTTPVKEGVETWELRLMAVDVKMQKKGLAGLLMSLVEQRVSSLFAQRRMESGDDDDDEKKSVQMAIMTIKEINGQFYTNKGCVSESEQWHEPGTLGSEMGFTVLHMFKDVTPR